MADTHRRCAVLGMKIEALAGPELAVGSIIGSQEQHNPQSELSEVRLREECLTIHITE